MFPLPSARMVYFRLVFSDPGSSRGAAEMCVDRSWVFFVNIFWWGFTFMHVFLENMYQKLKILQMVEHQGGTPCS